MDEKKKTYEPLLTEITSLGTAAGIVDSVKPGGLVAIGTSIAGSIVINGVARISDQVNRRNGTQGVIVAFTFKNMA